MLLFIGLVLLGVLLLVGGGEALLRGAVGLAQKFRLTPAVIGLTVVAAGTSVPELAVSALAAMRGAPDLAVGNVVGSNLVNIAGIVGLSAFIRTMPVTGNTLRLEYPVLALVTFLSVVLFQDGTVSRLDAALLLVMYVAFTAYLVVLVRDQATTVELEHFAEEADRSSEEPEMPLGKSVLFTLGGMVLLGAGAQSTVEGAVGLARLWGLSERVIGLTIVSIGTSLPEVVASVMSSLRGRSDVALGNVIGSNLFNLLVILGITGLVHPIPVHPQIVATDAWVMLGVTLLLAPLLFTGRRVTRGEGGLLLGVFVVYLAVLLRSGG